jgi:endoribonuclease LACTB2
MLNVNTIAPGVQMISYTGSRQRRANCYVLGEHELLLVEPSCETEGLEWLALVDKWSMEERRIVGIVLTHWHPDHTAGLTAMAAQLPGAPLPVWAPRPPGGRPSSCASLGLVIEIAEGADVHGWRVVHTPGHAPEHVCLHQGSILIAGDMISRGGATVFDERAYRRSYARLVELAPSWVLPAHGNPARGLRRKPLIAQVLD